MICGRGGLWERGEQVLGVLFSGTQMEWGPMIVRDKRVFGPTGAWLDYSNLIYKGQSKSGRPDFAVMRRQGEARIYKSKFIQNIIEFLSRLVLTEAWIKINQKYRVVLSTHDELVCLCEASEAQQGLDFVLNTLKTPPTWCPDLPIDAEGGFSERYNK
jgi:DNA polymerase